MREHRIPLAAFLAGDLDPEPAHRVDEHLLTCDRCWQAVREGRAGRAAALALREPASPQLVDRVKFAIQLAPAPPPASRTGSGGRWVKRGAAATGVFVLMLGALIVLTLLPRSSTHEATGSVAIGRIVTIAANLPPPPGPGTGPVALDAPRVVHIDGQAIRVQTYAFHGSVALLAVASRPFPMPSDAVTPTAHSMPWTIRRGAVTVYCPHADVLLAGPGLAPELAALAAALHVT